MPTPAPYEDVRQVFGGNRRVEALQDHLKTSGRVDEPTRVLRHGGVAANARAAVRLAEAVALQEATERHPIAAVEVHADNPAESERCLFYFRYCMYVCMFIFPDISSLGYICKIRCTLYVRKAEHQKP